MSYFLVIYYIHPQKKSTISHMFPILNVNMLKMDKIQTKIGLRLELLTFHHFRQTLPKQFTVEFNYYSPTRISQAKCY